MAFTPMLAAICGISSTKPEMAHYLPDPIMTAAASDQRKTMPIAKGVTQRALPSN